MEKSLDPNPRNKNDFFYFESGRIKDFSIPFFIKERINK